MQSLMLHILQRLPLFAALLLSFGLAAQSPCQPILNQAQAALNSGDTEQALRKLQDVEICDDGNALIRQRQRLQNAIFVKVDEQRLEADAALIQVEEEKTRTQTALSKTQKLVDAFYFYDDKFALAFKDNRFYFINKQGYKVEKLGEWRGAEQFGQHGYAQVNKTDRDRYLLDTMGQYLVPAQSLSELNRNTEIAIIKVSPDLVDSLIHSLNKSPNLKKLHLMVEVIGITGSAIAETAISPLFEAISKMKNLEYLDIIGSGLTFLPPSIGQLTALQELNLSFNWIETLPPQIGQLGRLQSLNLANNHLTGLPPEFRQLTNLKTLSLERNKLSVFPEETLALSNLTDFSFECDSIRTLPAGLGQLSTLECLRFACYDLNELPIELYDLTSLKELMIEGGLFTTLSERIGQLKRLEYLEIAETELVRLPPQIGQLSGLKRMKIISNKLTAIPPEIGQLNRLKVLLIFENQLRNIPAETGNLLSLETLDFSKNQIAKLDKSIGDLQQLRTLNLSNNQLSTLPVEAGQLTNLRSLRANNNQLVAIPPELGNLAQLQELILHNNNLTAIPPELSKLHQLEKLNLGANNLSEFSLDVSNLMQLEVIDLYRNKISKVPEGLEHLPRLIDLSLEDNPLSTDQLIHLYGIIPTRVYIEERREFVSDLHGNKDYATLYQIWATRTIFRESNEDIRDWRDVGTFAIFSGEFENGIRAAQRTLELDPNSISAETILAFAYLLNDQWTEAEVIFLKSKGKRFFDNSSIEPKEEYLTAIDQLESAGITHPDFAKVRTMFE